MDFDLKYTIIGFLLKTKQKGVQKSYKSNNYQLTPEQREALGNLDRGTFFRIDSIYAICPDKEIRQFPSMEFQID